MQIHLCWNLSNLFSVIVWVWSGKAHVFLLKDFRWSKYFIPWHDMLLLLEGETVKLPALKTFTVKILWSQLMPLYLQQARVKWSTEALTIQVITRRQMMTARWKTMPSIFSTGAKKLPPCQRCYAKLVFSDYKHLTSTFTKISNTLPYATNTLP